MEGASNHSELVLRGRAGIAKSLLGWRTNETGSVFI